MCLWCIYTNVLKYMYGFCLENAMGYGISESMGYGLEFPAYRHGSSKILWGMREYGLSGVWVIRVLTVTVSSKSRCHGGFP